MNWPVTQFTHLMHIGILIPHGYSRSRPPHHILVLYPGNVRKDVPMWENPSIARTFLNQFVKTYGNYTATDLRTQG